MTGILVALDTTDLERALEVAGKLAGHVSGFKVGLGLLTGAGPDALGRIASLGKPVMADAKLHDIPNTVERAASNIASAGARWVTVHALGGREMLAAAVQGMQGSDGATGVIGVTVLTSLDQAHLIEAGIDAALPDIVGRLVDLAAAAGAEGIVCSPFEASSVKARHGDMVVMTPGIRLPEGDIHDQKRVMTPSAASGAGADYLIIGRAITAAEDPVAVVESISKSLRQEG